jgi:hypothetical protein
MEKILRNEVVAVLKMMANQEDSVKKGKEVL